MAQSSTKLAAYVQTKLICTVSCDFCNREVEKEHDDLKTPRVSMAKKLFEAGWREVESAELAVIGLACPSCVKETSAKGAQEA